ncbi:MAG: PD-(D/E)XK nuclease family protein [Myxococcaceae bacterium]|nr:PD-(D/E)XK nuclease family protein [Myxococcaceae bacterium]
MDPSLQALLPRIREAVGADTPTREPTEAEARAEAIDKSKLFGAVRDALKADDRLFASEDALIASQVSSAIPRIVAAVTSAIESARQRMEAEAPWALFALESELDLLSPLKKERQETAHTLYLAYFLDSRKPHGLGTRVLRELCSLIGQTIPGEDTFEALGRPGEDNERRLRGIRVSAEEVVGVGHAESGGPDSRRCDVWMELFEEARSLIVVIENKVDAGEHGDQLSAYESAVWERARLRRHLNFEARLIFLTPDGRPPGDVADKRLWTPLSYRQLAVALARASRDAPEPGRSMLTLYIATILRHVLKIPSGGLGLERIGQLKYMSDVLNSLPGAPS